MSAEFIWGTTEDWAGSGPHKVSHADPRFGCCWSRMTSGLFRRVMGRGNKSMAMTDRDNGDLLEVWQCPDCFRVWFRRPGMTGFFMVQPASREDFR